jgi:putative serine protease PepD
VTGTDRSRLRHRTAAATAAALLGAAILAIVLFATGTLGTSANAATTPTGPTPGNPSLAGPLNAPALYNAANPSIVDITATDTPTTGDTGTGFLIDTHGHILTADHIIYDAKTITVKFQDGTTVPAQVLGHDRSSDIAVLEANPSPTNAAALTLGSTSSLVVGDSLAIIGNPFGYNRSLSTGVVSALDRTIQAPNGWLIPHAIQTDATINPGDSGGPVLNKQGAVVGIVDQIATGATNIDSATGVGFAVPIDIIKPQLTQLEHGDSITHPYLGITTSQSITKQPGALIQTITPNTPATTAGLQTGDLITAVQSWLRSPGRLHDTTIHGPSALVAIIAAHHPGQKLTLTVVRGSNRRIVTVTLGTQPTTPPAS